MATPLTKEREELTASIRARRRQIYRRDHNGEIIRRNVETNRKRNLQDRMNSLTHYSAGEIKCSNPLGMHKEPFTDVRALTLGPVNEEETIEAKQAKKKGGSFYAWLRKKGYPEGYQVLCFNCFWIRKNWAKEGGGRRTPTTVSTW
ncbi:MAG: hypothetical protein ABSB53_03770 [Nitrososphaerales archaeon]|jgi:hypothetical protein